MCTFCGWVSIPPPMDSLIDLSPLPSVLYGIGMNHWRTKAVWGPWVVWAGPCPTTWSVGSKSNSNKQGEDRSPNPAQTGTCGRPRLCLHWEGLTAKVMRTGTKSENWSNQFFCLPLFHGHIARTLSIEQSRVGEHPTEQCGGKAELIPTPLGFPFSPCWGMSKQHSSLSSPPPAAADFLPLGM